MSSENGWSPGWVGAESLVWVTVPGTDVRLQFQKGWPAKVLGAFAADYNQYVEPLRDRDSASYTATNSVSTSNHLNGTAMDLNWDTHPFRVKGTFSDSKMRTIRELLAFYENTVFWAGDWKNPIDEMHWQMGYTSFQNQDVQKFITRKLRSDGFSTFRRGVTEAAPKAPAVTAPPVQSGNIDQLIREIHAGLFTKVPSSSIYASPGEGPRWKLTELVRNGDAASHQRDVEDQARAGNLDELARVAVTAQGKGNVREAWAVARAQRVLAEIEKNNPEFLTALLEGGVK